jgi:uncharacterized protein (UPF0303 family)
MGVPIMMMLLQQKVIHLHMDGKGQLNACCIQYKRKNMNRFHTSSKTVTDFKQTEKSYWK